MTMNLAAIDAQRTELLRIYYHDLMGQASVDTALQFLHRISQRALVDVEKRSLCVDTTTYKRQIASVPGVVQWLTVCGWRKVVRTHREYLQLVSFDKHLLQASIDLLAELQENRLSQQQRDQNDLTRAEKEEEERLAKVKAQIAADKARRAAQLPLAKLR